MKKIESILLFFLLLFSFKAWSQLEVRPSTTIQLGTFYQEKPQSVSFELINQGTTPIFITRAKSGCPCFEVALYEKKIPPSVKIPLDIFIDARRITGVFTKKIELYFTQQNFSTNLTLFIEGDSRPAIQNVPKIFSAEPISLGTDWSTNLVFSLREDLTVLPKIKLFADPSVQATVREGEKKGKMILHICLKKTTHPFYWKGEAHLFFPDHLAIPVTRIQFSGSVGGSLHFSSQKEYPQNGRVRFLAKRVLPSSSEKSLLSEPLQSATLDVSVRETFLPEDPSCSQVELILSKTFLERLKKEGRISVSLSAKGFIPTSILLEKTDSAN